MSDTRTYKTYVYEDGSVSKVDVWGNESDRRTRINKDGYAQVTVKIGDKRKRRLLHRLIAQTWLPNPENKRTVNHKDGDKLNNHIDNLEWATVLENLEHARLVLKVGTQWIPVVKITKSGHVLERYENIKEAERNNPGVHVYHSVRGNWIRGEYVFVPEEELTANGIDACIKNREKANKGARLYGEETVKRVQEMREAGMSEREVRDATGISRHTIRKMTHGTYFCDK